MDKSYPLSQSLLGEFFQYNAEAMPWRFDSSVIRNTASSKLGLSPKAGPTKSRKVANGLCRFVVCPSELVRSRGKPISSTSWERLTCNLRWCPPAREQFLDHLL